MRPATDRRRELLPIGLLLLASAPGCARLMTINPLSRVSKPAHPDANVGQAAPGEGYASRLKEGTAPEGERVALASNSRPGPGVPDRTDDGGVSDDGARPVSVAIRAPRIDEPNAEAARPAPRGDSGALLKNLVAEARKSLDGIGNYQVRLSRQESVGGTLQPAEEVLLSLRRKPLAVRIEWPDGPNKGREALYAAEPGDGQLHVKMPNSIVQRTSLSPTSPLVLRSSRHPITEAGFDSIVSKLESDLAEAAQGPLRYRGLERPEGVDRTCHKIERISPEGETWTVYLDRESALPVAVRGISKSGDLLERYIFEDFHAEVPQLAEASAFNPDARWGPSRGLFGRMAQGQGGDETPRR